MVKLSGIDHLAVYSNDLGAVEKFFRNAFGLKPSGKYKDEIFFTLGEQTLAFFKSKDKITKHTISHIALKVDDARKCLLAAKRAGARVVDEDSFVFEGLRMQLVE